MGVSVTNEHLYIFTFCKPPCRIYINEELTIIFSKLRSEHQKYRLEMNFNKIERLSTKFDK